MTKIIRDGIVNVSVLTPAQANSKDGKGRIVLQGYLSHDTTGKGRKQKTVVHEFSCIRPLKPLSPGRYAFEGTLVLSVDDETSKSHEAGGVTYAKHNARILGGGITKFEPIPDSVKLGAMPF